MVRCYCGFPSMRPHGISRQSFLVCPPDLRTWVTVAFWTSLSVASLSAMHALVSGFCSSGYDFAIPSFRLHLAVQTLGVAMGFVGNYAPRGLSPQTDGMPVIPQKAQTRGSALHFYALVSHFDFPVHLRQVSARSSFSTVRGSNRMTLQAN